jgi:hypothetical protein
MKTRKLWTAGLITLIVLLAHFQEALAHESVTVGDYELEIGWIEEPPIAGQQNAIVVIISDTSGGEAHPVEDASSLEVTVSYGGQSKALTLQRLDEDSPGQFMAPLLPTVPGEYTIILGGQLGDTTVDVEVHPEEVQSADILQFPRIEPSGQSASAGIRDWLTWLAILLGLVGVGLGISAHRKAR